MLYPLVAVLLLTQVRGSIAKPELLCAYETSSPASIRWHSHDFATDLRDAVCYVPCVVFRAAKSEGDQVLDARKIGILRSELWTVSFCWQETLPPSPQSLVGSSPIRGRIHP